MSHEPLPSALAGFDPNDAQGVSVLYDIDLVTLMETMAFAQWSRDRDLTLAVESHAHS